MCAYTRTKIKTVNSILSWILFARRLFFFSLFYRERFGMEYGTIGTYVFIYCTYVYQMQQASAIKKITRNVFVYKCRRDDVLFKIHECVLYAHISFTRRAILLKSCNFFFLFSSRACMVNVRIILYTTVDSAYTDTRSRHIITSINEQ